MKKFALLAPLFALTIATPALAEDWSAPHLNWKDVSSDLKDLHADVKDLRADRARLYEGLKAGTLSQAQVKSDLADIRRDKIEIHNDIKDLRHDGVVLVKGKH